MGIGKIYSILFTKASVAGGDSKSGVRNEIHRQLNGTVRLDARGNSSRVNLSYISFRIDVENAEASCLLNTCG